MIVTIESIVSCEKKLRQYGDNSTVFVRVYGTSEVSFFFHNTGSFYKCSLKNSLLFYKKTWGLKTFHSFLMGLDESVQLFPSACHFFWLKPKLNPWFNLHLSMLKPSVS